MNGKLLSQVVVDEDVDAHIVQANKYVNIHHLSTLIQISQDSGIQH